jgi:hypothetical protein
MSGFLPRTDNGLLAFVTPFSAQITATPTAFGLTAAQATAIPLLLSPRHRVPLAA